MNYKVVSDNEKREYSIYETQTEQVVKVCNEYNAARAFMKKLNLGAGFDGWSPSFMLYSMEKHIKKQK